MFKECLVILKTISHWDKGSETLLSRGRRMFELQLKRSVDSAKNYHLREILELKTFATVTP